GRVRVEVVMAVATWVCSFESSGRETRAGEAEIDVVQRRWPGARRGDCRAELLGTVDDFTRGGAAQWNRDARAKRPVCPARRSGPRGRWRHDRTGARLRRGSASST